ncbi:DUF3368 domain-containing protein [Prosthecobacter sp.]|uniref:DUF3368 domain-containing protein n=1 Tax=Prosthecobacter sp. TaxID=1965333 RepID=UPI002ABBEB3D|nr:DUF3368 domain-containing protein [Prosthecobacter sp.]MDZ4403101.1 DUF3368 domain-containing protein [Prosthecobacter sp.]
MIVVSDTTAISNLLTIGRTDLLITLFERVIIPPAVWTELLAFHPEVPDWLEVVTVSQGQRVRDYQRLVHAGEAEAIALALEVHPDWLLIDDSDGRRLAKQEGTPVIGLMGVLLLAKEQGLLPSVKPLIDALESLAGFYLSGAVRDEVLRLAGEGH